MIGFSALVFSFSSCSIEKRLYSSGLNIHWNVNMGGQALANSKKLHLKQPVAPMAAKITSKKSEIVVIKDDCRVNRYPYPNDHLSSMEPNAHNTNEYFHLIKNFNDNKAIKSTFAASAQLNLQKSSKVIKPIPGESVEQKASRKAKKAQIYGIISIPTVILMYSGFILGIVAIILALQARQLVEDQPYKRPILKRANAGITWGTIGILVSISFFILILIAFSAW